MIEKLIARLIEKHDEKKHFLLPQKTFFGHKKNWSTGNVFVCFNFEIQNSPGASDAPNFIEFNPELVDL